jgi:Tfp pilus assembly ATPase PilU
MKNGVDRGMQTFDESLYRLYESGRVTLETALEQPTRAPTCSSASA